MPIMIIILSLPYGIVVNHDNEEPPSPVPFVHPGVQDDLDKYSDSCLTG